jgi:chromatin segregation and condensation protein Rec8/ScpA/Scc1 (kleisin family)
VIALAATLVALKRDELLPQAEPVESFREEPDDEQVAA